MEQRLKQALSLTIEALCNSACSRYDDPAGRTKLYEDTLALVREMVGPELRLTTMKVVCAWCDSHLGDKEGNGAVGDSHGICVPCAEAQGTT